MSKTYKDLKKQGKHVFDEPTVKQRKHFAPATKTEKPKKGKGSYDRGNAFDEDEESYSGQYKKGETSEAKKRDLDANRKNRKNNPKSKLGDLKEIEDEDTNKIPLKDRIDNALKESTNLHKFIEAIMTDNHAEAHKHLKQAINSKIQNRIAQEIEKPLF